MTLHGWYSAQQAARVGVCLYKHKLGHVVKVTNVTRDKDSHGSGWPDMKYIGEVTDWIQTTRPDHEQGKYL